MNKKKIIFLVLILSLFLRLGIGYLMKDSFFERGNRYSSINPIAQNIIRLHEFSIVPGSPTANNEPLYPLFVAFSYFLFGTNWFSIAFMQSILNLFNGILIYSITSKIFNNHNISFLAFLLFLFYPFYVFQSISVSDTIFFCFLLGLSTLITIKYYPYNNNFWISLFIGCSWGLTLLTRTSALFLIPFALVYIIMRVSIRKALKSCIAIIFGCLLIILPWIYRNYYHTGKFFIVTTRGALAIWYGYNNDTFNAIKKDQSVDLMGKNLSKKMSELRNIENKEFSAAINREVEISKIFIKHAVDFALKNPLVCLKMLPVKFWKFWSWKYNPDYNSGKPFQDIMRSVVYTLSYLPILILALGGIVLTKHSWRTHSIFLLLFLGYSLLHTIVYGFTRLRIPLDQFLIIYAAYAIIFYLKKLKKSIALIR